MSQEQNKKHPPVLDYETPTKPINSRDRAIKAVAIAVIIVGLFVIAIILFGPTDPPTARAISTAYKAICANNLKQIGTALLQYAKDNNNQFPPDLQTVMVAENLVPKLFICPASQDIALSSNVPLSQLPPGSLDGHVSYIYLRPTTTPDKIDPATVVAIERLPNHQNDGMNVLFGDFHVEYINSDLAWPMIADLLAHQNPPPSYLKSIGLPSTQPTPAH